MQQDTYYGWAHRGRHPANGDKLKPRQRYVNPANPAQQVGVYDFDATDPGRAITSHTAAELEAMGWQLMSRDEAEALKKPAESAQRKATRATNRRKPVRVTTELAEVRVYVGPTVHARNGKRQVRVTVGKGQTLPYREVRALLRSYRFLRPAKGRKEHLKSLDDDTITELREQLEPIAQLTWQDGDTYQPEPLPVPGAIHADPQPQAA